MRADYSSSHASTSPSLDFDPRGFSMRPFSSSSLASMYFPKRYMLVRLQGTFPGNLGVCPFGMVHQQGQRTGFLPSVDKAGTAGDSGETGGR